MRENGEMELGRAVAASQYLHFGMEGQFYQWSYGSRRWSVPDFFSILFLCLVLLPFEVPSLTLAFRHFFSSSSVLSSSMSALYSGKQLGYFFHTFFSFRLEFLYQKTPFKMKNDFYNFSQ